MDTNDASSSEKIPVDLRLWNILQETVGAAHGLRIAHAAAASRARTLKNSKDVPLRDEMKVVAATKDFHWFGLSNVLKQVQPAPAFDVQEGKVMVTTPQLLSRVSVRSGLKLMVDAMLHQAGSQGLVKAAPVKIDRATGMVLDDGSESYRGPQLRQPVMRAFNALSAWDAYMAEMEANKLFSRLCRRPYIPEASQNQLALPAPSVASQRSTPPGNT